MLSLAGYFDRSLGDEFVVTGRGLQCLIKNKMFG